MFAITVCAVSLRVVGRLEMAFMSCCSGYPDRKKDMERMKEGVQQGRPYIYVTRQHTHLHSSAFFSMLRGIVLAPWANRSCQSGSLPSFGWRWSMYKSSASGSAPPVLCGAMPIAVWKVLGN